MNEKAKSPSGHSGNSGLAPSSGSTTATAGCSSGNGNVTQSGNGPPPPPPSALASNNNNDAQVPVPPSPYGPQGIENMMPHYHMHPQQPHPQHLPLQSQNPNEPSNKEGGEFGQSSLSAPTNTTGVQQHPVYGRYHHGDPNVDPYRYGHSSIQQPPPGSKAQQSASGGMGSPNRQPQQRYIPGQPPQGPTPTLNSLLQSSHPPPTQHRYTNNYDPQQTPSPSQQQHGASQQQVGIVSVPPQTTHAGPAPPPHHQHPYAAAQQGGWAPPPRPYSPQLGPSQQYRTPPPPNTSRCPSPYSQPQSQTSGPFQNPPQQQQPGQPPQSQQQSSSVGASGVPPVTQSTSQGATTSNYLPYPQRYPTPPGSGTVSNHRTSYATHQYTEQNRPWTGASSPGPSPAPSNHPLPPASPHHSQHAGPTPSSSPGHAPSPSPQPSQASPSPHQELVGQNSNDSLSGAGGHGVLGSGQPGTPNSQPVMRPTPSPTGSSGSRSMSPAVAQNHSISRPSSNQSSSGTMQQQPGGTAPLSSQQPQSSQQQSQNSNSSASNSPQQGNQQGTGSLQVSQQPPPPNQNLSGTPPQAVGQGYGLPPHMHGSYKMSGQSPGPGIPPAYPPSTQQTQQYSQGSYTPRQYPPSNYGTNPQQPNQSQSTSNMNSTAGSSQYPNVGRPVANHGSPGQYPPYQSWVGPPPGPGGPASTPGTQTIGNHVQGKGSSPQGSAIGSPRPLNYLKQHLQHKSSYPGPNGPPIGYGNGPAGMPPGMSMGPPHHMGPPPHGAHTNMGPPPNTPPQSMASSVVEGNVGLPPDHIPQDNGLSSGSSGPTSGGPTHPVTSVVTTGPDGTTMDDVSQQSTLSNASAASSDDPQCTTPKSRKNDPYVQSHLAAPSTSPGVAAAGSTHSGHPGEDYEINSPPNWARTPASPSYNSHVPPAEVFRSTPTPGTPVSATASAKKSDSLCKLYEMDDNPERRGWLDKLRAFMDERRTPITACPTISKQPLDLYRLYLYVKERGGFVEVCKVTKSKTWKDIAGLLGIGASSSAAYTLRKHYTKNLLAFECHFDRGDIDPLPIIQQVEAGTKKKSTKAASVPSPAGSSNSQDSFPAPAGTNNTPMDGYPPYAATYSGSGGPQQDYGAAGQLSRPPSQSNSQNLHPGPHKQTTTAPVGSTDNISVNNPFDEPVGSGSSVVGDNSGVSTPCFPQPLPPQVPPSTARPLYSPGGAYQPPVSRTPGSQYTAQPGSYNQYPSNDQYSGTGPSNQFSQQQGQFPPQNRNIYPPYGPEGESAPSASNQYGPYSSRTYGQPPPVTSQSSTPPGAPPAAGPQSIPTGPGGSPYPSGQQEYYRPPEQGPRRHPDFVKDSQQYPGYNARPQMYGWPNASNQYRSQYQSAPSAQGWGAAPPRTTGSPGGPLGPPQQAPPTATSQWDQHRYPPQQQPPPPQQQQQQQQQQQPPQQPQQAPFPPQQQNLQQPPSQWPQMGPGVAGSTIPGAPGSPLRSTNAGQQQQQQRMPNIGTGQIAPGPQTVQTGGLQPNNSASVNLSGKQTFSMPPPSQANSVSGSTQPGSATLMPSVISGISQKPLSACNSAGSSQLGIPPQSQHQPIGAVPQLAKKEIVFPPDSIEATTPILYRRKRLAKGDVCPIDPWRIFMAMRSGQLTECTWALDVLNVLLFDDSTVQHFGLAHLPGLLTLLLEHFQKNLAEMFADEKAEDVKTMLKISRKSRRSSDAMKHVKDSRTTLQQNATEEENRLENDSDSESYTDEGIDLGQIKETPDANERVVLLAYSPNYTMMSRKGLPVRLQNAKQDLFITDELKSWDTESTRNYEEISTVGCNSWTYGFIEPDLNGSIIDVFKTEIINIPFARYIKMENNFKTNDNADKSNAAYDNFSIKQEQDVIDELNNKNITHLENIPIKSESTFDEELVARIQQNTFNKKRRLFNNLTLSDGNAGDLFHLDPIEAKKSKTHNVSSFELNKNNSSSENSGAATNTDSDCREVDMDLETISSTKEPCRQTGVSECFDPRSTIRDPAFILQRRRSSSLEDECYTRDESSLYLVTESQDSLARRCICISNIFRNLSFVPGNESVLAKSPRFLAVLGRLLLLNHEHLPRTPKNRNYDRGTEDDTDFSDSCSSLQGEKEWWWDYLICIRENMLVIIANIAGHLDLSRYEELIARPIIDGLLHWAVCPSAHGQDPFPSSGPISALSPQRLALEALCKLCVTDNNVDLVIATPPHSRLEKLCAVLTRHLCRNEDQVLREFSVNLLHYLAAADSAMARTVALQSPCISYLVAFIEQAEQTALGVANQHGINYLRENPDSMGTSLDMLRRTAGTLLHLAKHPDNRSLFMQQEQRLLGLVMSHILDQQVALIISRVLFQVSRGPGTNVNSLEYRLQQKQLQQKMGTSENNKDKEKLSLAKSIAMSTRRIDKEILYQTNDIKLEQIKDNSLLITDTGSAGCGVENFNNIMNTSTSVTKSTDQCNTKPSSASSTMVSFGDSESSDSSSQITHSVAFNDISNSSTNSSSCGTVVSNHSTLSQSSNSNVTLCATIGSTGNISSTNMHVHTSSGSYQSDHPKININSTAPTSQNNSNTGSIQMINTNSTELSSIPNASASSASTAPTSPASVPPSQTSTVTTSTAAVA